MLIHKPLQAMKKELEANEGLQDILGDNIGKLITYKPTLNASELNEMDGAEHFITLSIYKISELENHSSWVIKAGVAVSFDRNPEQKVVDISVMKNEVIRVLTQEDRIFGFAEDIEFTESEESFFDNEQRLWGYILFFVVKDDRLKTSITS